MAASLEAERPPKKPRYEKSIPFVPEAAIAASRSSAILDTEYAVKLDFQHETTDSLFFPGTDTAGAGPDAIEIGESLKTDLSSRGGEKVLRDAVFTELKRQGIKFPASSEDLQQDGRPRGPFSALLRRFRKEKKKLKYKEQNLANVLGELGREHGGSGNVDVVPSEKLLHGLNVTTASLPDMTVLRDGYLYFGEFKNSEKYTEEVAAKQCTRYLYALMYFLRVRLGRPVKAVFGFFVCGAGCFKEETKYSVGYIRLSAPEKLGESCVPRVFKSSHNVDSVAGIQKLVCFLKEGKSVELDASKVNVDVGPRTPALLSLPTSLWGSDLRVPNGTASMVFKGNGDQIRGLLDGVGVRRDASFDSFLSSAHSFLSGKQAMFFLKIRLKETTLRESPARTAAILRFEKPDFFRQLYPIDPYGNGDCGLLVMNDCGDLVDDSAASEELVFPDFCGYFADLWKDLIAISDVVLHGDALPHNIVYNESNKQKLVLIDFDEGMLNGDAYKRVVKQSERFAYLRYPNFLRYWVHRKLYTQLQLAVSFVLLAPLFQRTMVERDKAAVGDLADAAKTADSFLEQTNDIAPTTSVSDLDQSLYRLVELLQEMLNRE